MNVEIKLKVYCLEGKLGNTFTYYYNLPSYIVPTNASEQHGSPVLFQYCPDKAYSDCSTSSSFSFNILYRIFYS